MFAVALIGADGAGKTTIGKRLRNTLPLPVKYIYMGDNPEASNYMLPTTRLLYVIRRACSMQPNTGGPPDPARGAPVPKTAAKRLWAELKSTLWLANWVCEEWFRQIVAWYYLRRGHMVLFDRHFFFDYYAHHVANESTGRPLATRLHGYLLNRFYPKPNLVICLDAPLEMLFARKSEGTVEALGCRRNEYWQTRGLVKHFAMVDARGPVDIVVRDVADLIWDFYKANTRDSVTS